MVVEKFRLKNQNQREMIQKQIIADLEDLLDKAHNGELSGLAYVEVDVKGQPGFGWRGWNAYTLGNAIATLHFKYFNRQLET